MVYTNKFFALKHTYTYTVPLRQVNKKIKIEKDVLVFIVTVHISDEESTAEMEERCQYVVFVAEDIWICNLRNLQFIWIPSIIAFFKPIDE